MAHLSGPATAATAPQPPRNHRRKSWLRTPLCNHRATIDPATGATIAQPRCNKAQPCRNHPIFSPRNHATIPLRGGEMVAPLLPLPALSLWRLRLRLRAPSLRAGQPSPRPEIRQHHSQPQPGAGQAIGKGKAKGRIDLICHECALRIEFGKISTGQSAPRPPYECRVKSTRPPRDSLATIERDETAGRMSTHQRACQRVCRPCSNEPATTASADTVQTRQHGQAAIAHYALVCAVRPFDCQSRDGLDDGKSGQLHARAILPVPTLEVRKARVWNTARAQGPGRRRNVELREMAGIEAQIDPAGVVVGGKQRDLGIIDLITRFRGLFPIIYFDFSETTARSIPARPGLQKSGGFRFQKIRVRS
jgi:hypothetical protein